MQLKTFKMQITT